VASFIRLSPLRIVLMRAGTRRRSVTALTATASVGETIAPSANAIASGQPGDEPVSDEPDHDGGERDEPDREEEDGPLGLTNSRSGMSQPSAKSSGGRKQRKKNPGSSSIRGNAGNSAAPMPPKKIGDQLRPWPAHRPTDAQARDEEQEDESVFELEHRRFGWFTQRR